MEGECRSFAHLSGVNVLVIWHPGSKAGTRTVLLVEDDTATRTHLLAFLQRCEPRLVVVAVNDADDALAALRGSRVDVVVADLRLPGMDGIALLHEISRLWPRTHRIMMTAFPNTDQLTRAVEVGQVQTFMTKPMDPDAFLRTLRSIAFGSPAAGWGRIPPA